MAREETRQARLDLALRQPHPPAVVGREAVVGSRTELRYGFGGAPGNANWMLSVRPPEVEK